MAKTGPAWREERTGSIEKGRYKVLTIALKARGLECHSVSMVFHNQSVGEACSLSLPTFVVMPVEHPFLFSSADFVACTFDPSTGLESFATPYGLLCLNDFTFLNFFFGEIGYMARKPP